jgi:hypothetical protein
MLTKYNLFVFFLECNIIVLHLGSLEKRSINQHINNLFKLKHYEGSS